MELLLFLTALLAGLTGVGAPGRNAEAQQVQQVQAAAHVASAAVAQQRRALPVAALPSLDAQARSTAWHVAPMAAPAPKADERRLE